MARAIRSLILSVCALGLLSPTMAHASGAVGGLARTIDTQNVEFSLQLGWVERDMNPKGGNERIEVTSRRLPVRIGFGANHYFNLYGIIGLVDLQTDPGDYASRLETMGGGGVRFSVLPPENPIQLVIDGQFVYYTASDDGAEASIWEYQAGGAMVYRVQNMSLHLGMKFSQMDIDFKDDTDLESEDPVGAFVGTDYFINPNVFFSMEIQIFDAQAIYAGVGFKL